MRVRQPTRQNSQPVNYMRSKALEPLLIQSFFKQNSPFRRIGGPPHNRAIWGREENPYRACRYAYIYNNIIL